MYNFFCFVLHTRENGRDRERESMCVTFINVPTIAYWIIITIQSG